MQSNKKKGLDFSLVDGNDTSAGIVFEADHTVKPKAAPTSKAPRGSVVSGSRVEFSVPEKFGQKKESQKPAEPIKRSDDMLGGVSRTYVPKFTEVSQDYKMQGKAQDEDKKPKKSTPEIIVVPYEKKVDPTKEIEENKAFEDAKVVTVGVPEPEIPEIHSTVFKFETKPDVVEEVYVAPEPEAEVEVKEESKEEEPKSYSIPDPVFRSEGTSVGTLTRTSDSLTPETVGDVTTGKSKYALSEFTAPAQRDSFKDKFLDSIMSVKVRLFASAVILVALLFIENLWLFGVDIPHAFGIATLPGNMALLDLHLIVALYLLALPEVILSIRKLISGRFVSELFISAGAVASIFYSVVVVIKAPVTKYPLFGMIFGITTVGAIVATLFKKLADFSAFKTVSSSSEKRIVDRKLTRSLPEENHAVDGKVEGYKSKIARVYRAGFIADFFKRSGKGSENSRNNLLILGATFGLSLVAGLVAFFVAGIDILVGATVFAAVFMLGVPAFTVITHKMPFFHASCEASVENSAVIGEASLYDYAGVDVLTFRDTEIFTDEDVNLQRIMLYGKSENLEKAMHQMSAIFAVVGGPLENMFLEAIEHKAPRANNITIESDGIIGEVGGCEVRAGSLEYMLRNGITIPEDHVRESSSLRSTKVMYAAENGEVYAKFYIRYTLSEEFTMLLPVLVDDGITPLVYTRDPNISTELFRTLTAGADNIRVLKRYTLVDGDDKLYNRVSVGLVTTGDKINVINMLLLSKKYVRFQNRIALTELSAAAVGSALGIVLSLTGMIAVPSLFLGFWQLAWCAALFFMSKRTLLAPIDTKQDY